MQTDLLSDLSTCENLKSGDFHKETEKWEQSLLKPDDLLKHQNIATNQRKSAY